MVTEVHVIMLNECEQLGASRAATALDARLTNHVVAPSVNPALGSFKDRNKNEIQKLIS